MRREVIKNESFTENEQHLLALVENDSYTYLLSTDELIEFSAAPSWACRAALVEGGVMYFENPFEYEVWQSQN